ncbi:MAG: hypothetical protein ACLTDS_02410 [Bianqueaceae bacterium]
MPNSPAASGETTMPAGILNEKCTPVRRATTAAGGHTVVNSCCQRRTTMPAGILNENARR